MPNTCHRGFLAGWKILGARSGATKHGVLLRSVGRITERSQLHFLRFGGTGNLSILAVNALAVKVLVVNSVY